LAAQIDGPLTVAKPVPVRIRAGGEASSTLKVQLDNGYHVNTNTPSDAYLIPLRLTWEAKPIEVVTIEYPKGLMEKYQFSEKPLSVYTGDFALVTKFKAPAGSKGSYKLAGKLRYQACTVSACYPPKTVNVEQQVEVR
jgi:hypothetical protein